MHHKIIKRFSANEPYQLTKKGLDALRQQLNHLREEQLTLCRRLMGMDVKEKEEYILSTDAGNHLEKIEHEVMEISDILSRAVIIEKNEAHSDIRIGSIVFLESEERKEPINYTVVNSIEADPSSNKISEDSPLGRALIGKKEKSVVSVSTPGGKRFLYKVLAIR